MVTKVLKIIRSKIDTYKLNKLIKAKAKETDDYLALASNKKFKYLGTNHILCSTLIKVNVNSMLVYRDIFKKLSEFDMINPKVYIDYNNLTSYTRNVNVNKFLTNFKGDPKVIYKETIHYYKLFNYKFIEFELTPYPNKNSTEYLTNTRRIKYEFLSVLKIINDLEL